MHGQAGLGDRPRDEGTPIFEIFIVPPHRTVSRIPVAGSGLGGSPGAGVLHAAPGTGICVGG